MRKEVFLNELPKTKNGKNISWKDSIGYKVHFIYDDIEDSLEIVDYYINDKSMPCLIIKYKNKIDNIGIGSFYKGGLGRFLGKITSDFKIEIGTIIKDDKRNLTIIDREIRRIKNINYKFYKYHCNIDGNEDWIEESNLLTAKQKCNVCSNKKPMLGVNTIWDKARWMVSLGMCEEDAKKYMISNTDDIYVTCPYCKTIKKTKPVNIHANKSIACNCGDGISYPEKFTFKLLEQLNIDFIWQYTKINAKWCDKYKYDFYFMLNEEEYIVEVHGEQHYNESFSKIKGCRTLEEEQENDRLKHELAINNGIKPENYIVIDCRYSELDFIKQNILNSKINKIFDLTKVDWNKCEKYALSNIIYKVCEYWKEHREINKENIIPKNVGDIFNLEKSTIIKYLHKGTKVGWCNYTGNKRKVIMYDENMNFIGEYESSRWIDKNSEKLFGVHLDFRNISSVINGKIPKYKGYIFKRAD